MTFPEVFGIDQRTSWLPCTSSRLIDCSCLEMEFGLLFHSLHRKSNFTIHYSWYIGIALCKIYIHINANARVRLKFLTKAANKI